MTPLTSYSHQVNRILGYLASHFTLLLIYLGLTNIPVYKHREQEQNHRKQRKAN